MTTKISDLHRELALLAVAVDACRRRVRAIRDQEARAKYSYETAAARGAPHDQVARLSMAARAAENNSRAASATIKRYLQRQDQLIEALVAADAATVGAIESAVAAEFKQ